MESVYVGVIFVVIIFIIFIQIKKAIKEEIRESESRSFYIENLKHNVDYHLDRMTREGYFYSDVDLNNSIDYYKEIKENGLLINNKLKKYKTNKPIKILIGDYDVHSISNSLSVLESFGIEVVPARSGIEIINRIKSGEKYDLIITNNVYRSGHCDGPIMLERLKASENFNTPIVVLTVSKDKRHLFVGEYNFDEYMTKLLTQEQVLDILPKVIKNLEFTEV